MIRQEVDEKNIKTVRHNEINCRLNVVKDYKRAGRRVPVTTKFEVPIV